MGSRYAHRAVALATVVAAVALLLSGCTGLSDHQSPTTSGSIRFSSLTSTGATLSWTAAVDNYTASSNLQYQLYMSKNPEAVDTLADIQSSTAGSPVASGKITSATVADLSPGTPYYFNVVVQDDAHNAAAYKSAELLMARQSLTASSAPVTYDMSTGGTIGLNLTLSGSAQVYAIVTNAGTTSNDPAEVSSLMDGSTETASVLPPSPFLAKPQQTAASLHFVPANVRDFLRHPATLVVGASRSLTSPSASTAQTSLVVGTSTNVFFDENGNQLDATLRAQTVSPTDNRKLNIWVANSIWDGSSTGTLVNGNIDQDMVNAAAAKFLDGNDSNDIYHWETSMYGAPWGSAPYTNLIPDDGTINILFMDMGTSGGSYTVGFFYARDNYDRTVGTGSATDYSNQMLMFYLNSYAYTTAATGDSSGVSGQNLIYSTLAHEFQHMIQFYQKTVLLAGGNGTDTWINEMMSMMTEDILADKIQTTAEASPRGIIYSDPTASAAPIQYGRMPYFDAYDDISLSNWGSVSTLGSYGIAYAFGAYLARNYGGATLLHDMMHSSYTDAQAVTQGVLAATGQSLTMATLLTRWAASVILSSTTAAPADYQYNVDGLFPSTSYNGIAYNLGSINAFNYSWNNGANSGPYMYDDSTDQNITLIRTALSENQDAFSSQYIYLGDLSGAVSRMFTVGADNYVTIVVK